MSCITCEGSGEICKVCGETEGCHAKNRLAHEFAPDVCHDCGGEG